MTNKFNVEQYQDCVVEHKDGTKRIGRIQKDGRGERQYFNLASYQDRKCHVVWPVEDVVKAVPIDFDI
tara:strand:- start:2749 stop:2952 length:204 start_codon:yes stop_codon:yes gene_type:complete